VATRHGGIIDKYMGDGVMVLFPGRPGQGSGPQDAVDAALGIQEAIRALNEDPDLRDAPVIVRSSVEYGPVILGTVGHEGRFDTTVISDVANVAARLQGWCRTLDVNVLVTERCASALEGRHARPVGDLPIRGRTELVVGWEVYDTDPAPARAAKDLTAPGLTEVVALRRAGRWEDALARVAALRQEHARDGTLRWLAEDCAHRVRTRS
jgi:class 3 adenylate cyclase